MRVTRMRLPFVTVGFVTIAFVALLGACGRRPAPLTTENGVPRRGPADAAPGGDGSLDLSARDGGTARDLSVDRSGDGGVDLTADTFRDAAVEAGEAGLDTSAPDGPGADAAPPLCTPTANPAGPPVITAFSQGCLGGTLTIRGTNLGGEGTCVLVGGTVLAPSLSDLGDLVVNLPASLADGATLVQVATLQGGTDRTAEILALPAPAPVSIAPGHAAPGVAVTISGTDLAFATSVLVLGVGNSNQARPAIDSQTATTLTFAAPALPDGSYSVILTNPCGMGTVTGLTIMR